MRQANNNDEEYFALDEGFLDKPTFELIKKWKTSNEKDRIKKFKSTTVTPEEASELKEMISIMRTDDIDYKEYKKAFHKFCTFIHTIDKGVILKTINLTKNKDDDNYTLYVEYADNTKKITLPDDCKLYHLTKVSGIKKLIPFFKGKNQKGYLYDKPRIYFTIRKKMPKFLADYKVNDKMYTYECIKDIKDVYVDPLVPSFIQGAVYIETPNPVPVEQVGMKAGSNDEDTVESKNEAYIEEMMEREEFESISETGFDFDEFFDMITESGFEDLEPVLEDEEVEEGAINFFKKKLKERKDRSDWAKQGYTKEDLNEVKSIEDKIKKTAPGIVKKYNNDKDAIDSLKKAIDNVLDEDVKPKFEFSVEQEDNKYYMRINILSKEIMDCVYYMDDDSDRDFTRYISKIMSAIEDEIEKELPESSLIKTRIDTIWSGVIQFTFSRKYKGTKESVESLYEDDELEDRKPDEEKDQENPESKEEKHEEPKVVEEPKEEPSEETDEDEPEDEEDKSEVADSEDEEDDSEDAKDTEEEEDKESSEKSKEDKKESDESKEDHDEEKHDDLDKEEKEEIDDIEDTDEISDAELADDDEELELQADEVDDVGSETDTEELSGEEMDVEDDDLDLDDDDESTDDDIYDDEEIEDDDIEDDELDTEDDSVEDIDTSEGISTDSEVVQERYSKKKKDNKQHNRSSNSKNDYPWWDNFDQDQMKEYKEMIKKIKKIGQDYINKCNKDPDMIETLKDAASKDLFPFSQRDKGKYPDPSESVKYKYKFDCKENDNTKDLTIYVFDPSIYKGLEECKKLIRQYDLMHDPDEYECDHLDALVGRIVRDIYMQAKSELSQYSIEMYFNIEDCFNFGNDISFMVKKPTNELYTESDMEVVQESKTFLGYRGTKKLEQKYHIPDKYCIERRDIYEMFSTNEIVKKASNAVKYIKGQEDINRYFMSLFKSLLGEIAEESYASAVKLKKSDLERYTTSRQMYQLYKQTYKGPNPIDLDKLCKDLNKRNIAITGGLLAGGAALIASGAMGMKKYGDKLDKQQADFAAKAAKQQADFAAKAVNNFKNFKTHGNGISIVNNAYTDDLTDQEYISEYCMCLEDYIDDMNLDTITEADMEVITEGINSIMNKISSIVDNCNKKIAKRRAYIKDRKQLKKETKNYDSLRKGNWYNNLNIIIKDYRKLGTYDSINKESKKIFDDLLSIFIDNYNAIADSTTNAAAMRGTLDKDKKFLEHTKEKMQKEYKDFNLSGKLDDIFGIKSEPEKEHKITNSDVADILMTGNHINDIYQAMERYIDQWESEVHKQNRGVAQRNKIRDEKVAQIEDEEQKEYIKYCIKAADMLSYIMSIEFNACDRFCGIFIQDTQEFFTEIDRYIKVINAAVDAHHAMNGVYTKK